MEIDLNELEELEEVELIALDQDEPYQVEVVNWPDQQEVVPDDYSAILSDLRVGFSVILLLLGAILGYIVLRDVTKVLIHDR